MSLIGDSKEEDREIFRALKEDAKRRRKERHEDALEYLEHVKTLVDNGKLVIDSNYTWNMKLKGVSIQYWPTKGRWQYTCPKLIERAKAKMRAHKRKYYFYPLTATLFGGGIHKFIKFLEARQ